VGLDIGSAGTPSARPGDTGTRSQSRDEPDPQLTEQFREKMAARDAPADGQGIPPPMRPFDLFGHATMPADAPQTETQERVNDIQEAVARLLVSDASRGPAEVRIRLKDELLPGTEIRVRENSGRLEIDFVASDPESANWVAAQAETIAGELSRRLRREVRLRVQREGEEAGQVAEAGASESNLPGGPAALFAHRPLEGDDGNKDGES
jgi:hypothetical protein